MRLMNIDEEIPEFFYIFVGQGSNKASQINYHNYKLTHKIISSGFESIMIQHELIDSFIEGDIDYIPYIPNKTSFNVPSSHSLSVVNSYTTEYALERYRYNNNKMFPSRFSCVYAFGDIKSCELANKWNVNWDLNKVKKFKLSDLNIELGLSKAVKICKCNMDIVTYMWNHNLQFFDIEESDKICNAYWRGKGAIATEDQDIETGHTITMNSNVLYEYLIEGILEEIE